MKESVLHKAVFVDKVDDSSPGFFLRQRVHFVNVVIMSFMWAGCSFNSYMISMYVKYLPGNIYVNTMASGGSQVIFQLITGFTYLKLGIRLSFTLLFSLSFVGGLLIIILGEDSTFWMPFFVVLA